MPAMYSPPGDPHTTPTHTPQAKAWPGAIEPILDYMRQHNTPYSLRTYVTLIQPHKKYTDAVLTALTRQKKKDFWSS